MNLGKWSITLLAWSGLVAAVLVLSGCALQPLKGGLADNQEGWVQQGQNPQVSTVQEWERVERFAPIPQDAPVSSANLQAMEVRTTSRTTLGAAQEDTSRELAAKFANMRPVQWVGILLIVGAAALAYFKWWTPAMIAGGTGVGLIAMAHSIVGNERLIMILLASAAAILLTFRAYEKGKLDSILPDSLDKNSNPTP